jgi:hypothetical protein
LISSDDDDFGDLTNNDLENQKKDRKADAN